MNCSQQETEQDQETTFGGPSHIPNRIIHFSSGETLELDEKVEQQSSSNQPTEQTRFSFKNVAILVGRISLLACDFLGERLAGALGLNAAKYQYAIDQHNRQHTSQTSGDRPEGQVETFYLAPGAEGSGYGATGPMSSSSNPHESCREGKQGCHNRGYQAEEDSRE